MEIEGQIEEGKEEEQWKEGEERWRRRRNVSDYDSRSSNLSVMIAQINPQRLGDYKRHGGLHSQSHCDYTKQH